LHHHSSARRPVPREPKCSYTMGQRCEDQSLPRGEDHGRFSRAEHPRGALREKAQGHACVCILLPPPWG
ncbi:unnamed protein product, partial [Symbiodinium necroappetens]